MSTKAPSPLSTPSRSHACLRFGVFSARLSVPASPKRRPLQSATLRWLGSGAQILTGVSSCSLRSLDEISQLHLFLPVHPPTPPHWRPSKKHLKHTGKGAWERIQPLAWVILTGVKTLGWQQNSHHWRTAFSFLCQQQFVGYPGNMFSWYFFYSLSLISSLFLLQLPSGF